MFDVNVEEEIEPENVPLVAWRSFVVIVPPLIVVDFVPLVLVMVEPDMLAPDIVPPETVPLDNVPENVPLVAWRSFVVMVPSSILVVFVTPPTVLLLVMVEPLIVEPDIVPEKVPSAIDRAPVVILSENFPARSWRIPALIRAASRSPVAI